MKTSMLSRKHTMVLWTIFFTLMGFYFSHSLCFLIPISLPPITLSYFLFYSENEVIQKRLSTNFHHYKFPYVYISTHLIVRKAVPNIADNTCLFCDYNYSKNIYYRSRHIVFCNGTMFFIKKTWNWHFRRDLPVGFCYLW